MNSINKFFGCMIAFLLVQLSQAQDLLDPTVRDESINDTKIVVVTDALPSGVYHYTYKLVSSNNNKGDIRSFALDISCDIQVNGMADTPRASSFMGDTSDGQIVPVVFDFSQASYSYWHSIGAANDARWLLALKPGKSVDGIRLISPAPPQQVVYTLTPVMRTQGWDYDSYEEDDQTVPWTEDFTVTGMVEGPGCPSDAPPPKGEFLGSGQEPKNINKLITYSTPDSTPVKLKNNRFTLVIHYDKLIEEDSFAARLDGKDVSDLFTPKANSKETVVITAEDWQRISRLRLSVKGTTQGNLRGQSNEKRPEKSLDNPAQEKAARKFDEHRSKDVDLFHIHNF